MPSSVALTVARYRPERESEPTFQTYEIPFRKDWVVLDALNHVKDSLDGSLSFRWSCRMGVCGSCGMKVNGTPKLTCATFLSDYLPGPIRIEPLDYFPVVRDLVVDLTDFVRKLRQVKPWIIRKEEKPPVQGEILEPLLEPLYLPRRLLESRLRPIDARTLFHDLVHLGA